MIQAESSSPRKRIVGLVAAVLIGTLLGLSVLLTLTSNAAAYLSDDPKACINCHIMRSHYASWEHSSHARVAVCNDCHVPQDSLIRKLGFKAKDGLRHATVFTMHNEPQAFVAKPDSRRAILDNCQRCHGELTSRLLENGWPQDCLSCHRDMPHGRSRQQTGSQHAITPPPPALWPIKSLSGERDEQP